MSDTPAPSIAARIDEIDQRYQNRFANRSRVTRDPDELERLAAELAELAPEAPPELEARLAGLRELYASEIAAIREAQAHPFAVQTARLRTWADLTFSRYDRNFAGRDRRTRDVGLLEEMIADLDRLRAPLAEIAPRAPELQVDRVLAQIDRALGVYRREAAEIRNVRRQGTLPEQGTRLAEQANHQFHVYTLLFAKQSRISRHPPALRRIVTALEEIRRAMQALEYAGFNNTSNRNNQRLVDDRLRAFRQELDAIERARAEATVEARVSALAQAANQIAESYRERYGGKPRSTVDPDGIAELFEQLWPVAREMDELDQAHDDEINGRNLGIVTDNLLRYADEYRAIVAARAGTGAGAGEGAGGSGG